MLKTILKISRHAENHVKEFQGMLKHSFQNALQISTRSEI